MNETASTTATERWGVWCVHPDGRRYWLGDATQTMWTRATAERVADHLSKPGLGRDDGCYEARVLPVSVLDVVDRVHSGLLEAADKLDNEANGYDDDADIEGVLRGQAEAIRLYAASYGNDWSHMTPRQMWFGVQRLQKMVASAPKVAGPWRRASSPAPNGHTYEWRDAPSGPAVVWVGPDDRAWDDDRDGCVGFYGDRASADAALVSLGWVLADDPDCKVSLAVGG